MKITNICVNGILKNKKSKTLIAISLALSIVGIALIIIVNGKINERIYGKKVTSFFRNLNKENNILNPTSYIASYDITIVSNKNTNTYSVKEYFKAPDKFRFDLLSKKNNNPFSIIINQNNITIRNEKEVSIFKTQEYVANNLNYMSIYSVINIYNQFLTTTNTCDCKCTIYEKNQEYNIYIISGGKQDNTCVICNNLKPKDISNIQLVLDSKYIPKTLAIYNKNMLEKISIVYNNFVLNKEMQDEVFEK